MDIEHEKKLVKNFFRRALRKRLFYELTIPKKRSKIFGRLASDPYEVIDSRYLYPIPLMGDNDSSYILKKLIEKGALADQMVYIMCNLSPFDGKYIPLKEAIKTMVYKGEPLIISCIPGQLAYFEGEEGLGPPPRFILERKQPF
ncbi:MAG: hypothetical protein ABF651_10735 [Sporolactobacillus sp.]